MQEEAGRDIQDISLTYLRLHTRFSLFSFLAFSLLDISHSSVKGVDACQGDSGGPASVLKGGRQTQVRFTSKGFSSQHLPQIGIVSLGKGCGDPRFPGLYTSVSSLLTWVKKITSGYTVWNSSCQKI